MKKNYVLSDRKPAELYRYFEDISEIPRISGNEEEVAAYITSVAESHGLWYYEDELHNVLVRKKGSKGCESLPYILLEGHLDMVGEKTEKSDHDFAKDPIRLIAEGNILHADQTTLGADNGCAVALMLKVLTDESLVHPPLECLFTAQEEVGLIGIKYFDVSRLKSRRVIGLDAGAEGVFRKGTSTKFEMTADFPIEREAIVGKRYRLIVDGLRGGDQGAGIPLERISAIKMTARVLHCLNQEMDVRLISIDKGGKSIPENCLTYVTLVKGDEVQMEEILREQQESIRIEYAESDGAIRIQAIPETLEFKRMEGMLKKECSDNLINALYLMPYGARNRRLTCLDEVSCSVVMKQIETGKDRVKIFSVISAEELLQGEALNEELQTFVKYFGFHIQQIKINRGWDWEKNSPIRDVMVDTYEKVFGKSPKVNISHGGNDCVVLKQKLPEMDMITTAATYVDYHTPNEFLDMDSFERLLLLIERTLEALTL